MNQNRDGVLWMYLGLIWLCGVGLGIVLWYARGGGR
jgi:hypothetical protein